MTEAETLLPPFLPYGRQSIDEEDIAAVVDVLRSDWLTTGPAVERFEKEFASAAGTKHAVAVSNGTAALHCAMAAAGIGPGDEVIVPTMTFVATASSVVFQGGTPVFADVEPETLLVNPASVQDLVTERTKAIVGVDYAGQPCRWDALQAIADEHGVGLIDDACHAVGGSYKGRPVGSLADLNTFSFHPVKHMTTAEGGMVTTDREDLATTMRTFRNHGITTDHRQRAEAGAWRYEMTSLGYNYRLSDIQAALGLSQLGRLADWVTGRQALAERYDQLLANVPGVDPLDVRSDVSHAYHLYVVRLANADTRQRVFEHLRERRIGANVHYSPVHLHPYYRTHHGTKPGSCPIAESTADTILSLPMFPALHDADITRVISAVQGAVTTD